MFAIERSRNWLGIVGSGEVYPDKRALKSDDDDLFILC